MNVNLDDLEGRLDRITLELLPPLRVTKVLDSFRLTELLEIADGFVDSLAQVSHVSRILTGKLWYVFTAMLTEAEYAKNPDPILDAAWMYHERLIKIYGPFFDELAPSSGQ